MIPFSLAIILVESEISFIQTQPLSKEYDCILFSLSVVGQVTSLGVWWKCWGGMSQIQRRVKAANYWQQHGPKFIQNPIVVSTKSENWKTLRGRFMRYISQKAVGRTICSFRKSHKIKRKSETCFTLGGLVRNFTNVSQIVKKNHFVKRLFRRTGVVVV